VDLIRRSADITTKPNLHGFHGFHICCQRGHVELVKEFLIVNPKLLTQYAPGSILPLQLSISAKQRQVVQLLIQYQADINCVSLKQAVQPLYYTINQWIAQSKATIFLEIFEDLLKAGASINHPRHNIFSYIFESKSDLFLPLVFKSTQIYPSSEYLGLLNQSIRDRKKKLVSALIAHKVDLNYPNMEGQTPLHICNNEAIVQILIDGNALINSTDHRGNTPLHHHLLENHYHTQVINRLITAKANVNQLNHDGLVPLHCARMKNTAIITLLLSSKADIHSPQPETFKTILHRICELQSLSIHRIKPILEANADPNKKDKMGRSPLHYAVQQNSLEVIELLLSYGANINGRDNQGGTPLLKVIDRGDIDMWRFLVKAGADVNVTNSAGVSAKQLAPWKLDFVSPIVMKRAQNSSSGSDTEPEDTESEESLDDEDDEDDEDDDSEDDDQDDDSEFSSSGS